MTHCTLTMANGREMTFELFPDKAPITVSNFAHEANRGFFDGLTFCRIVKEILLFCENLPF